MTREETLKGIAALNNNEEFLSLIEAQQALSDAGGKFAHAMDEYYGEDNKEPQGAVNQFYEHIKEMDGILGHWLYELLYAHFAEIR